MYSSPSPCPGPTYRKFFPILQSVTIILLIDPPMPYAVVLHDEIHHEMTPRGHLAAVVSLSRAAQPANCRSTAVPLILRAWLPYEKL